MSEETPTIIVDDPLAAAAAPAPDAVAPVPMDERWPTSQEFLDAATQDEAVAVAATEILSIQAGIIRAIHRCNASPLPAAIKALFNKKMRSGVSQLYSAIPGSQLQEMVEMVVMTETMGGPEKIAELQKQFAEEEAARFGAAPETSDTKAL